MMEENFFNPASDTDGVMLDEGRYILTVLRLEPTEHAEWGLGIKWVFSVAPAATPEAVKYDDQGNVYEFWQSTSRKMSPRAKARKWSEVLLGRKLEEGQKPSPRDLIGRKMNAMIVHEPGADGGLRARVSSESLPKPYGTTPAPVATNGASRAPAVAVGGDRKTAEADLARLIGKADALDLTTADDYKSLDLSSMSDADVEAALMSLKSELLAAV